MTGRRAGTGERAVFTQPVVSRHGKVIVRFLGFKRDFESSS